MNRRQKIFDLLRQSNQDKKEVANKTSINNRVQSHDNKKEITFVKAVQNCQPDKSKEINNTETNESLGDSNYEDLSSKKKKLEEITEDINLQNIASKPADSANFQNKNFDYENNRELDGSKQKINKHRDANTTGSNDNTKLGEIVEQNTFEVINKTISEDIETEKELRKGEKNISQNLLNSEQIFSEGEDMSDELSDSDYIPDTVDEESASDIDKELTSMDKDFCDMNEDIPFLSHSSGTEVHTEKINASTISTKDKNVDEVIMSFGNYLKSSSDNVEEFSNTRPWTKKSSCPYCFKDVTHFPRHLIRNHKEKGAVKELVGLSLKDPKRKELLNSMRRQGNFVIKSHTNTIRPIRRPNACQKNTDNLKETYIACPDCLGFFKRNFLRRHRKSCACRPQSDIPNREQHLSAAQLFAVCSSGQNQFYSSLRLKSEIFPIMRNDIISKIAMGDTLICSYAESLIRKHKRTQIRNVVSNKMRELGRLLLSLKNSTGLESLFDALKPQFFDNLVSGTKVISGYDEKTHSFKASSLAMHMGTSLKQVCDMATKMIIQKSPMLTCREPEECLKDIKRLRNLIENHWNSEISSLALKNLNEQRFKTSKLLPLTEDVMKFQTFLYTEAKKACNKLRENQHLKTSYRRLSECVLVITLLLNRKRIGEIQYLKLETYNYKFSENQQTEFLQSLSDTEKTLIKKFKRVITEGKGSKPVAILFSKEVQEFIEVLLSVRNICVPHSNKYLFANYNTTNGWLSGYHTLKKLAAECGVSNKDLFTSTRLRKHIATILQVVSMTEGEMEQFASFMGHTKKTHETFYRLPQDVYQTAKISKLLIAVNKGNSSKYKGKSLDEIDLTDTDIDDSDIEENRPLALKESLSDVQTNAEMQEMQNEKRKVVRTRWTEDQKKIVKSYFKNHIKKKQAPRKQEVERFLSQYETNFKEIGWLKLKAFVYNCYK